MDIRHSLKSPAHPISHRTVFIAVWSARTICVFEIWIRWISLLSWNRIPNRTVHTKQKSNAFFWWSGGERRQRMSTSQLKSNIQQRFGKYLCSGSFLMFFETSILRNWINNHLVSMFAFWILSINSMKSKLINGLARDALNSILECF